MFERALKVADRVYELPLIVSSLIIGTVSATICYMPVFIIWAVWLLVA